MAGLGVPPFSEGGSSTRPPLFTGVKYTFWKQRMTIFIQKMDWRAWQVIVQGDNVPTKTVDSKEVPKLNVELTENDMRLLQVNSSAMNALYCALDANEYNHIIACKSAKEIWKKLEIIYEGTRC
ncbi:hypothetical protein U1Q18_052817 [Sarracenia purpurea var. burkii]